MHLQASLLKCFCLLFIFNLGCDTAPVKEEVKMDPADPGKAYELSKFIPEPPEKLYSSFIHTETMTKVWAASDVTLDPKPGGKAAVKHYPGYENKDFTILYKELVPNEKLKWTEHPDTDPGKEIMTTIIFKKAKGGTNLTLRQENFTTADERDESRKAWETSLMRLEGLISWK